VNQKRQANLKNPHLALTLYHERSSSIEEDTNRILDNGPHICEQITAGILVLFIRKARGGLRFYCNYCTLNKIIIKDCYPLH